MPRSWVLVLVLGVGVGSWMGRVNVEGMEDRGTVAGTDSDRAGVEPVAVVAERIAAVEGSLLHFYNTGPGVILGGSGVVGRVGCLSVLQCGLEVHNTAASGCRALIVVNWL